MDYQLIKIVIVIFISVTAFAFITWWCWEDNLIMFRHYKQRYIDWRNKRAILKKIKSNPVLAEQFQIFQKFSGALFVAHQLNELSQNYKRAEKNCWHLDDMSGLKKNQDLAKIYRESAERVAIKSAKDIGQLTDLDLQNVTSWLYREDPWISENLNQSLHTENDLYEYLVSVRQQVHQDAFAVFNIVDDLEKFIGQGQQATQ